MVENNLEEKIETQESIDSQPGFLENVLDASGTAISTSMALKAMIAGATGYGAGLAYLIPYGLFKAGKYVSNMITKPKKTLSLKGSRDALSDTLTSIVPTGKAKVPAAVGVLATGAGYLGKGLLSYVI
jgi:hypothetical protein